MPSLLHLLQLLLTFVFGAFDTLFALGLNGLLVLVAEGIFFIRERFTLELTGLHKLGTAELAFGDKGCDSSAGETVSLLDLDLELLGGHAVVYGRHVGESCGCGI